MSGNKHDFEELTAPAATAKELQVSVATLRKYSLIVEKVTGQANYYARTKQNARLYSKQDIQDLQDFHRLAQKNGLTLYEAAQQVFAVSSKEIKKTGQTKKSKQEVMTSAQVMKLIDAFQQTISQQNTALENLQEQLNRIEAQNQELLQKQNSQTEKFEGLADISGIVTAEESQPKAQLFTAEQKRQQIVHDEKKSSEQLHDEILAKAQENSQKTASVNEHRTLIDMQPETETRHWWQRFLNL
ncbi:MULTISPECIES: transcriptional regulator [unclassified Lactobacillus]|uniref:transcriptional regulator n=1 Tax=unclassified Lactobacillus TaxID=2620435 RepID=UPI000EFC88FB|nr:MULTISPECIES: transcriptional regulator [unclassified Lactobacillus]RMC41995.1 transcriptional regulator [Lactobacillus sp. ESL0237]RMC45602.1 transcriptional regulator [Lactobacillus sp. ESL0234]RMC46989.1 transcriptional regulator [Lactobacillus sp. ESL0236]RMC47495.1 transcriptional regulator [Lactobacillus sp. ESL0230]